MSERQVHLVAAGLHQSNSSLHWLYLLLKQGIAWLNDILSTYDSLWRACWWCSYLANGCEAMPTMASLPFQPLLGYNHADQSVQLPAWGFLLVFCRNHSPKVHHFELWACDRWTDHSIALIPCYCRWVEHIR